MKSIVLILLVLLLISANSNLYACSCIPIVGVAEGYKVAMAYDEYDVIFSGKAIKSVGSKKFSNLTTFKVIKEYKGQITTELDIAQSECPNNKKSSTQSLQGGNAGQEIKNGKTAGATVSGLISESCGLSSTCDFKFEENAEYLVYVRKLDDFFTTNICSRTKKLLSAEVDLEVLEEIINTPNWELMPFSETKWAEGFTNYWNDK